MDTDLPALASNTAFASQTAPVPTSIMPGGASIHHCTQSIVSCDPAWEAAYERFETPEQEIKKFIDRLTELGLARFPHESRVVEICCGRGNGLVAFDRLGFSNIEGVDLSEPLLRKYTGKAVRLYVADCRELPFADQSKDLVVVQGGLHHLPELPIDVQRTANEVKRVLRPNGCFAIVEPYPTRSLAMIHKVSEISLVQRLVPKIGALASMIDLERETYEHWLSVAPSIREQMKADFVPVLDRVTWTKWHFVGRVPSMSTSLRVQSG